MDHIISAIRQAGLIPPARLEIGKWIRFSGYGKSERNKAAALFIFSNESAIFIDYSNGGQIQKISKNGNGNGFHNAEYQEALKTAEQERIQRKAVSIKAAEKFLQMLKPAESHPYLETKKIISVPGILQWKDQLIIPIGTPQGTLAGYQRIYPNGNKRFNSGCSPIGAGFRISGSSDILLCEGVATGISLHMATGKTVICALMASNLLAMAEQIRDAGKQCLICADNDFKNKVNTGIESAKKVKDTTGFDYIYPESYKDFNDVHIAKGIDYLRKLIIKPSIQYVKKDDIDEDTGMTTVIPNHLYQSGLIKLGMDAVYDLCKIDIPQYSFPLVLSMISTAIAGKVHIVNGYPSCFFIKIGGTQTGKSTVNKCLKKYMMPYFRQTVDGYLRSSFFGATDFASGPGLLRQVQRSPNHLIIIDEITSLFSGEKQNGSQHNQNISSDKAGAVLELATLAGDRIEKVYAKETDAIIIENACVNLIGNATPLLFQNLTVDDFNSGLIQRFDFFYYDGDAGYRNALPKEESELALQFVKRIVELRNIMKPSGMYDLQTDSSINVGLTPDAAERLLKHSHSVTNSVNSHKKDDGIQGIIARKYSNTCRFAVIHAASRRNIDQLFTPIELQDIEYGIELAELLSDWKIKRLTDKVHAGEIHMYQTMIIEAVKAAISIGKSPTWGVMCGRRPKLRNLTPRFRNDILQLMEEEGVIERQNSGKAPVIQLIKK